MKVSSLISKLNKLNTSHEVVDINGYNKDIKFTINGIVFKAGIIENNDTIQDFCREIAYCKSEQETQRRFFDNFNKLLKYANN